MKRTVLALLLFASASSTVRAQTLPALPVPEPEPIPAGARYVRDGRPPVPPPEPAEAPSNVLGHSWQEFEWLLWWVRDSRVPPLAIGSRSGLFPTSNPSTLVGGEPLDSRDQSGGRFTLGYALDASETVGLEGTYFFLGTRTTTYSAAGSGAAGSSAVGIPYLDVPADAAAVLVTAAPSLARGVIDVSHSARLQGAELNGVVNLLWGMHFQLDALAGFRFFQLHEGIQIASRSAPLGVDLNGGTGFADQFDGHNRFYGGQVGLRGELRKGLLFVGATAKLGMGSVREVVRIQGVSRDAAGLHSGGLFALESNSGRHVRDVFGLLPEATVRLGFHVSPRTRLFVGYNVLYLTDAARPGDQIDPGIDPALSPLLAGGTSPSADRPRFTFNETDFWVQGLILGVECRY